MLTIIRVQVWTGYDVMSNYSRDMCAPPLALSIMGCYVTNLVPHKTLKSMAFGQVDF